MSRNDLIDLLYIVAFSMFIVGLRMLREDWFVVGDPDDNAVRLAFGDGPIDYRPPRWPDPEYPQQLHVDTPVSDLDAAESQALRLGAPPLQDKESFRSYADPVGHPFCLCRGPLSG